MVAAAVVIKGTPQELEVLLAEMEAQTAMETPG